MNDILKKAIDHFAGQEKLKIEVPEWGDDKGPAIFFSAPMTLADRNFCIEKAGGANLKFHVYSIIRMLKNEDGTPVFKGGEAYDLQTKVDPTVLLRIGQQILRAPSVEDMEKNF